MMLTLIRIHINYIVTGHVCMIIRAGWIPGPAKGVQAWGVNRRCIYRTFSMNMCMCVYIGMLFYALASCNSCMRIHMAIVQCHIFIVMAIGASLSMPRDN